MDVDLTVRVPWGYGTQTRPLHEVQSILNRNYHPGYTGRLVAWLAAQEGRVGVGGHYRAPGRQPDGKPGFAPPGKSFHEGQRFSDGFVGAIAVDLVVRVPGRVHRAPYWSEVPKQGSADAREWGVHANVSTESWHMQPTDERIGGYSFDGHTSWVRAGRPSPARNFPIPGGGPAKPDAPVDWEEIAEVDAYYSSLPFPGTLRVGSSGEAVKAVQWKLAAAKTDPGRVDGDFGPRTERSVKTFQSTFSLAVDGLVGPATWSALGLLTDVPAVEPIEPPVDKPTTATFAVRAGDSWWSISEITYGNGTSWSKIASANGDPSNTTGPNGAVVVPDVKWTEVVAGDGWIAVASRLGSADWNAVRSQNKHITVLHPGELAYGGPSDG